MPNLEGTFLSLEVSFENNTSMNMGMESTLLLLIKI